MRSYEQSLKDNYSSDVGAILLYTTPYSLLLQVNQSSKSISNYNL